MVAGEPGIGTTSAKKAVAPSRRSLHDDLKPQTSRHTPEAVFGHPREEWPAASLTTTQTKHPRRLSSGKERAGWGCYSHG